MVFGFGIILSLVFELYLVQFSCYIENKFYIILILVYVLDSLSVYIQFRFFGIFSLVSVYIKFFVFLQIMEKRGVSLSEIDLSGMRKSDFTDEGLRAISQYCIFLEIFNISMCYMFIGDILFLLLEDSVRVFYFYKFFLFLKKVLLLCLFLFLQNG